MKAGSGPHSAGADGRRTRPLRIGTGAGFSGDRLQPAVVLAEQGDIDYLVLECLAERTIAIAHKSKLHGTGEGYDPWLEERLTALLPICAAKGIKIISNMGAANPTEAARRTLEIAASLGLGSLKVAAITGDDVLDDLRAGKADFQSKDAFFPASGERMVSANAYIGAFPIVEALQQDADVIMAGRVADPALFLAPLIHEFGWAEDDWHALGCGTAVGHLMECAGQITGGYFSDPGRKDVSDLANLGYPIAQVSADGSFEISKVRGTGGLISLQTCVEQLLYEVHNPARYLQPDVVADFSNVTFEALGTDRVRVQGATGHPRTETLKVSVGYRGDWRGEGQISYYGANSAARARQAESLLRAWLLQDFPDPPDHLIELFGCSPCDSETEADLSEVGHVRLRFVVRMPDRDSAK